MINLHINFILDSDKLETYQLIPIVGQGRPVSPPLLFNVKLEIPASIVK